jgi:hypothetical protein
MAKYQAKPVIVDAVQFDPAQKPWPDGVKPWRDNQPRPRDMSFGYIDTSEGRTSVVAGDWIVTEKGRKSICKPDVFEAVYVPVEVI